MSVFEKRSSFSVPRDQLAAYHERPGALERLIPPWETVRVVKNDGPLVDGKCVVLATKIGPVWKEWEAEHFDVVPGVRFRDRAIRGPFAAWMHSHLFEAPSASSSVLVDQVEYQLPFGILGRIGSGHVERQLARMFAFRHQRTLNDLQRHATFSNRPRLKVAVSGASGAIASNLTPFLTTAGHTVARLMRAGASTPRSSRSDRGRSGSHESETIQWDAATGEVDQSQLSECDALIHLAGKNIAVRWSKKTRDALWRSRVDATRKLCETLARMTKRPATLVCASAVGFYGDRGEEVLDETSARGDGFAAEMCDAWERATDPARDAGMRVVNMRTGVVISANSGALAKLLLPAKFGMAGRLGSGEQWMPWIAMDDIIAAIDWCVQEESIVGPVNGVTGSVRQGEFMTTLGRVLRRPTFAPLPAFGVEAIFGQMGKELLLASANVRPTWMRAAGFTPTFESLEAALRFELGRAS